MGFIIFLSDIMVSFDIQCILQLSLGHTLSVAESKALTAKTVKNRDGYVCYLH